MKIDNSYTPASPLPSNRPQPRPAASPPATTEPVSLSPLAGSLLLSEQPPVNTGKVQEIKEAIAQGRFKINPDAIAGRLLETARDLVNSQRKA